jgi:hypothetical protein
MALRTAVGTIVAKLILPHARALIALPTPARMQKWRRRRVLSRQRVEPGQYGRAGRGGGFDTDQLSPDLSFGPPEVVEILDPFRNRARDDAGVVADRLGEQIDHASSSLSIRCRDRAGRRGGRGGGRFLGWFLDGSGDTAVTPGRVICRP